MSSTVAVWVGSGVNVSVAVSSAVGDAVGGFGVVVGEGGRIVGVDVNDFAVVSVSTTGVLEGSTTGDATTGVLSPMFGSNFKTIALIPRITKTEKIKAMPGMMNFLIPDS